jgi:hypothetical protein
MSKKFAPTVDQRGNVEAMTGFGISQEEICRLIKNPETGKPIDKKTLELHFADEIETGQTPMPQSPAYDAARLAQKRQSEALAAATAEYRRLSPPWATGDRLAVSINANPRWFWGAGCVTPRPQRLRAWLATAQSARCGKRG